LWDDLSRKSHRLAASEIDTSTMREVIFDIKPIVAEIGRVGGAAGN
jgi:hypothetical protein